MARRLLLMLAVLLGCVVSSPLQSTTRLSRDDENKYRLPKTFTPLNYKLSITPHYPDEGQGLTDIKSFSGVVTITASAVTNTEKVILHAAESITITNTEVYVGTSKQTVLSTPYEEETEKLTINLRNTISIGSTVIITISYESDFIEDRLTGFYYSSYTYETNKKAALLATKFEPTHARKAYPCFDEPGLKATFDLEIDLASGIKAIANTPVKETKDNKVIFETSPKMTTYLLAFIVYEEASFTSTTTSIGEHNLKHTTWARKEAIDNGDGDLSQNDGPRMIEFMNKYTDIPYTDYMEKMDQVALPDFQSGAMENWGLVTYRENALLFDPESGTSAAHKRVSDVIAHELAHQWFGNLVVTDWWDSVWLNEGFANYFELLMMTDAYPDWRMPERFLLDEQMSIFLLDSTADSVPLTKKDVFSPEEIGNHFGSISYSKGGSILRQLSIVIGEDNFKEACRSYLSKKATQSSTAEELLTYFVQNNDYNSSLLDDEQLYEALISWTMRKGFPIVTIKRISATRFQITQERFLQTPETLNDVDEMPLYYVPLTWTTRKDEPPSEAQSPKAWLTNKQMVHTIDIDDDITNDDWVLFNAWQSGYYRVNYDEGMWEQISGVLSEDATVVAPVDRAAIVDNLLNLARAGHVTYQQAFSGISFLQDDLDFLPWAAARSALTHVERMLSQDNTYKAYIRNLVTNVYESLKWEVEEQENNVENTHRINIFTLACAAHLSDCMERAEILLKEDVKTVHKELQSVVYCYGLKQNDGDELWNKLWTEWEEANNNAARRGLLTTALGCTNNPTTLNDYLKKSLDPEIVRPQDAYTVFTAVYNNPSGVDVALTFLEETGYDELQEKYGQVRNVMNTIVTGLAARLTEESQKTRLETALGDRTSAHSTALATIESNLLWKQNFGDDLRTALGGAAQMVITSGLAMLCAATVTLLR